MAVPPECAARQNDVPNESPPPAGATLRPLMGAAVGEVIQTSRCLVVANFFCWQCEKAFGDFAALKNTPNRASQQMVCPHKTLASLVLGAGSPLIRDAGRCCAIHFRGSCAWNHGARDSYRPLPPPDISSHALTLSCAPAAGLYSPLTPASQRHRLRHFMQSWLKQTWQPLQGAIQAFQALCAPMALDTTRTGLRCGGPSCS